MNKDLYPCQKAFLERKSIYQCVPNSNKPTYEIHNHCDLSGRHFSLTLIPEIVNLDEINAIDISSYIVDACKDCKYK